MLTSRSLEWSRLRFESPSCCLRTLLRKRSRDDQSSTETTMSNDNLSRARGIDLRSIGLCQIAACWIRPLHFSRSAAESSPLKWTHMLRSSSRLTTLPQCQQFDCPTKVSLCSNPRHNTHHKNIHCNPTHFHRHRRHCGYCRFCFDS